MTQIVFRIYFLDPLFLLSFFIFPPQFIFFPNYLLLELNDTADQFLLNYQTNWLNNY